MDELEHHRVEVVPVVLEPHPNADTLSIVRVHEYQAVVKTEQWLGIDRGAYIPPDSLVPETLPAIAHIAAKNKQRHDGSYVRITVQRLRGHISHGVLVPAPGGAAIGDDVASELGVKHYAEASRFEGDECPPPPGHHPVYTLQSWRRFGRDVFELGERVIATEKIEGEGGRAYLDWQQTLHVGSRVGWKNASAQKWWSAIDSAPVRELLRCVQQQGQSWTLYGEVYGQVGGMAYDASRDVPGFRVFAAYDHARQWWVEYDERIGWCMDCGVSIVPNIYDGVYHEDALRDLADGRSRLSNVHPREGIVVEAASLRRLLGPVDRPVLKLVSDAYMERQR